MSFENENSNESGAPAPFQRPILRPAAEQTLPTSTLPDLAGTARFGMSSGNENVKFSQYGNSMGPETTATASLPRFPPDRKPDGSDRQCPLFVRDTFRHRRRIRRPEHFRSHRIKMLPPRSPNADTIVWHKSPYMANQGTLSGVQFPIIVDDNPSYWVIYKPLHWTTIALQDSRDAARESQKASRNSVVDFVRSQYPDSEFPILSSPDHNYGVVLHLESSWHGLMLLAKTDVAYRMFMQQIDQGLLHMHVECSVKGPPLSASRSLSGVTGLGGTHLHADILQVESHTNSKDSDNVHNIAKSDEGPLKEQQEMLTTSHVLLRINFPLLLLEDILVSNSLEVVQDRQYGGDSVGAVGCVGMSFPRLSDPERANEDQLESRGPSDKELQDRQQTDVPSNNKELHDWQSTHVPLNDEPLKGDPRDLKSGALDANDPQQPIQEEIVASPEAQEISVAGHLSSLPQLPHMLDDRMLNVCIGLLMVSPFIFKLMSRYPRWMPSAESLIKSSRKLFEAFQSATAENIMRVLLMSEGSSKTFDFRVLVESAQSHLRKMLRSPFLHVGFLCPGMEALPTTDHVEILFGDREGAPWIQCQND